MGHWKRSVSLVSRDIAEFLQAEIRLRWPEREYPYNIDVVGSKGTTSLTVHVWNPERVNVVHDAHPINFLDSSSESPTIAAVLHAIEAALAEASIQNAR